MVRSKSAMQKLREENRRLKAERCEPAQATGASFRPFRGVFTLFLGVFELFDAF